LKATSTPLLLFSDTVFRQWHGLCFSSPHQGLSDRGFPTLGRFLLTASS
jgi:hypothetical protein